MVEPRLLRRLYWSYQAVIAGLAILAVWLITLPDDDWIDRANLCIWAVFFADYATRLVRAPDRWRFVRQNIPDLIAIIPLDLISGNEEFALGRVFRLARLIRLVRASVILWRFSSNIRGVLETNGLGHVLLFMVGLVLVGGIAIRMAEPEIESFGDGVWWSLVTATTVGYGDISPKTPIGRVVAALLMVLGISTFGMVTASLTTFFMRRPKARDPHVETIIVQLDRWDELSVAERPRLVAVLETLVDA